MATTTITTASKRGDNKNKALPSLDEIKAHIPKECFEKNLPKSIGYMLLDFAIIAALYKVHPIFESFGIIGLLFWYFIVGMMASSVFIIGHDCGHGTFSDYPWVNDFFGHLTHGLIFAPYWPWQKSHRHHHMYTSHIDKDKGHAWVTESKYSTYGDGEKMYSNSVAAVFMKSVIGWPVYTIAGIADGSHFWPGSSLFSNNTERLKCVFSGAVCVCFASAAYVYFGNFNDFLKFYILPCLAQGFWLVMITYLQHQDDDIEVYEDGSWGYVKGQLQTIDRPYGFGIDYLMHHITDGHVAHHFFFTQIPHYNLKKATVAIQEYLKPYGLYKKQKSHDFLWQFASLNIRLKYLLGEGSGLLKYAKSKKVE